MMVRFMNRLLRGNSRAMIRLTLMETSRTSALASVYFSFSYSCWLNARMTRTPVRPSRATEVRLSIFCCTETKRREVLTPIRRIVIAMTGMAMANTMENSFWIISAFSNPPISMTGARTTILNPMLMMSCSWLMSFVVRVMRLAILKDSISFTDILCTFRYISPRRISPNRAPMSEVK